MKKILALVMVLALTFGLFVGCGDKSDETAREVLEKVNEASLEVTNSEFKADFDLEISGLDALGLVDPMGLVLSGKIKDQTNMMLDIAVETGQGLPLDASLYISEEKILIHAPLLEMFLGSAYIEMDLTALTELSGVAGVEMTSEDSDQVLEILDRFEEETEYSIYDILILDETVEEVEVTVDEEVIEAKQLKMTINLDDSVEMLVEFMTFITEDDEARALFFADYTDEDIALMKEEFDNPETIAEIEAALELLTINTFEFIYYVNEDYVPVKYEMTIDITVDIDGEATTVKLTGDYEMFNFGEVEDLEFPVVDPSEVMNLNDLLNLY